ncbi:MAG: hydrogenase maturation protease [Candidatus Eisenbacteria bacterium]|nr:hydrogenase maturation protease [Candidatus Eisenbacteria bacterium]
MGPDAYSRKNLYTNPEANPILILGIGNLLLKDEGVGIHFIRMLKGKTLPSGVEAIDGGTRGLDLLLLMEGHKLVVIVDCARMGEPPGTVRVFEPKDIVPDRNRGFSVHGLNLASALEFGARFGKLPEIFIVGVEPESIEVEIGLSEAVRQALPEIERAVDGIIARNR